MSFTAWVVGHARPSGRRPRVGRPLGGIAVRVGKEGRSFPAAQREQEEVVDFPVEIALPVGRGGTQRERLTYTLRCIELQV